MNWTDLCHIMSHVDKLCHMFQWKRQKTFCRSLGLLQLYKTLFRKKTKLSEKSIIIPLQTMIHKENIKVTKTSYRQSKKKVKENIMIIVSELVLKTLKKLGET